jgi:hypothetical protein
MTLTPGFRVRQYEIVGSLGAGGMGSACGPSEARTRRARASGGGAPRALKNANLAQPACKR